MAPTRALVTADGRPRSWAAVECCFASPGASHGACAWSCAPCHFDVCADCYTLHSLPDDARKAEEGRREHERERRDATHVAAEIKAKVGTPAQRIREVTAANKAPSGKGFTVWHSLTGSPKKPGSRQSAETREFDSSYARLVDANARARFKFYCENPWGRSVEQLGTGEYGIESQVDLAGHVKFAVRDADHGVWTVGVAPDANF